MSHDPDETRSRAGDHDLDLDRALRRAFEGVEAPPVISVAVSAQPGAETQPRLLSGRRFSGGRGAAGPMVAAVVVFLLSATMPLAVSQWEVAARAMVAASTWIARLAPLLACLVWLWLERPVATDPLGSS